MNKTILFIISALLTILSAPAFALDWGIFDDYKVNMDGYAMDKYLNNIPIKYHLSTTPLSKNTQNNEEILKAQIERELNYKKFIQDAFNIWPTNTKKIINKSGRAEEFKDITPYLNQVRLIQVKDKRDADLIINFTTEEGKTKRCGKTSDGCFSMDIPHLITMIDPFLYDSEKERSMQLSAFTHELGHFFGFTDQYKNTDDNDPTHSVFDRFNERSMMSSSLEPILNLHCDDIDAFINSIDLTLAIKNKGKFSQRAQKGWASFCNGKNNKKGVPFKDTFYQEARPLKKEDFRLTLSCIYSYDSKGNVSKIICPAPFNFYDKVFEYDNRYNNLVSSAQDADFKCHYQYTSKSEGKISGSCEGHSLYSKYFSSKNKEINGKKVWTISNFYNIKEYPEEGYVYVDEHQCQINNYIPSDDFKSYNLNFIDNRLNDSFSYSFLTRSIRPIPILVNTKITSGQTNCSFEICDKKILKKLGFKDCLNVFYNDNITQEIADYAAMNYADFVKQTENSCKENLSSFVINNGKALCDYFKTVDKYFKEREANNETISRVPKLGH